jgi:hypothetical protein
LYFYIIIRQRFRAETATIPPHRQAVAVACYFKVTPYAMTNEEILQAVRQVEGLGGMTVNERLYVSGLMNEFDKSKKKDKDKAAFILESLQVDKPSIDKILY